MGRGARGMNHFARFSEAVADLSRFGAAKPNGAWPRAVQLDSAAINGDAARALKSAQRFYLPEANHILHEEPFDDAVRPLARLPFSTVAVLRQTHMEDRPDVPLWCITLASEVPPEQIARLKPQYRSEHGFKLTCCIFHPDRKYWVAQPYRGVCTFPTHTTSLAVSVMDGEAARALVDSKAGGTFLHLAKELMNDAYAVANLCVMLNLANVKTSHERPSPKQNALRRARGKAPLYDYHVLDVGGERWDDRGDATGGDGPGRRSHLRRGHIRRLDDERAVWVRNTFVRGSVPGFVDKDYRVRGAA
jgi:hypothetical protein